MNYRLSTALSAIVLLAFAGCASTPESTAPAPAAAPAPVPAPAPAPAAPAAAPKPTAEKVTTASEVNFDFDRAVVRPDAKGKLDDLVTNLRGVNLEVIIAIGHADSIGSDAYNMKLSLRRADSVKAYLVSKGIAASRIYTEGKGERQPIADNKTKEGRAKNRRVEIEAVGSRSK
jgi:OmpA-OmpF porin, OOP family